MEKMAPSITFVVRARAGERGYVSGIVERVKTGEKHRFHGAEAIGPLIAEMMRQETPNPSRGDDCRSRDEHDGQNEGTS